MYRCQVTGEVSKPGQKLIRVVTETKMVHHIENGRETGTGKQIIKEINVSPEGLLILHDKLRIG